MTSAQVTISRFMSSSPALGSVLTVWSLSLSLFLSLSLSLSVSRSSSARSQSLSQISSTSLAIRNIQVKNTTRLHSPDTALRNTPRLPTWKVLTVASVGEDPEGPWRSVSGHNLTVRGFEPPLLGSMLYADSSKPGTCFRFHVSLSLSAPSQLALCFCLSQK